MNNQQDDHDFYRFQKPQNSENQIDNDFRILPLQLIEQQRQYTIKQQLSRRGCFVILGTGFGSKGIMDLTSNVRPNSQKILGFSLNTPQSNVIGASRKSGFTFMFKRKDYLRAAKPQEDLIDAEDFLKQSMDDISLDPRFNNHVYLEKKSGRALTGLDLQNIVLDQEQKRLDYIEQLPSDTKLWQPRNLKNVVELVNHVNSIPEKNQRYLKEQMFTFYNNIVLNFLL